MPTREPAADTNPTQGPDPFAPARLGPISLRNRIIRAATFEGMTPAGIPAAALLALHREVARGGVGMTTVAYCAVDRDGLTFEHQMVMGPRVAGGLGDLCRAVHDAGAAVALQLGHAGYFASPSAAGCQPLGPSRVFNLFTLTWPRVATRADLTRLRQAFARSAAMAVDLGFDALELHLGHGYLLSQFLSPYTNRRRDRYGGSIENRARFPQEVIRSVRRAVGERVALVAKINLSDGFRGGLRPAEAGETIRLLESSGLDALVLSGGFVSKTPFFMLRGELPVAEMVRNERNFWRRLGLTLFGRLAVPAHPYADLFFWDLARQVRRLTSLPTVLLGGVRSRAHLERAMRAGFDFVSMGRPLIHDPHFVARMQRGEIAASPCEPCNRCVAEMEAGGIRCTHPVLGSP